MVISGWMYGLSKGLQIKKNRDMLLDICGRLSSLQNRIRMGGGELSYILPLCFKDCQDVKFTNGEFSYGGKYIKQSDLDILKRLFCELGKGDRKQVCEKIEIYREILFKRYNELNEEYVSKSKVWQTFGLCMGLSATLMII